MRLFGYVVVEACALGALATSGVAVGRWLTHTPPAQAGKAQQGHGGSAHAQHAPPAQTAPSPLPAPSFFGLDDEAVLRSLRSEPVVRVKFNKGGSSVSLRLTFGDGSQAAFKPAQSHQFSIPRKEVVAYRISRFLGINQVAPAAPRVLSRDDIVKHLEPGSWSVLPRILAETKFDAQGRTVGMAQYWIPKIKDSNLDTPAMVAAWTGWLAPGKSPPEAKRAMAVQLSNLVVFDLVMNQRDRFSGGNMKVSEDDRVLYYMDNTAALFSPQSGHPKQRTLLGKVGLFSARTIERLRGLTAASLKAELAAEPDQPYELVTAEELAGVLARKDVILAHVDALIAKHGKDAVLAFP